MATGGNSLPTAMRSSQVEPSTDYAHLSSDRVAISGFTIFEAIVIGTIRVDKIDRDILTSALTLRYGLLDRLQLETRIPYVYRRDRETLGVGTSAPRTRCSALNAVSYHSTVAGVTFRR